MVDVDHGIPHLEVAEIGDERGADPGLALGCLFVLAEDVAFSEDDQALLGELEARAQATGQYEQSGGACGILDDRAIGGQRGLHIVFAKDLAEALRTSGSSHDAQHTRAPRACGGEVLDQSLDLAGIRRRRAGGDPRRVVVDITHELGQAQSHITEPREDLDGVDQQLGGRWQDAVFALCPQLFDLFESTSDLDLDPLGLVDDGQHRLRVLEQGHGLRGGDGGQRLQAR